MKKVGILCVLTSGLRKKSKLKVNFPMIALTFRTGLLWEKASELPKDWDIVTYCKISVRGWDAYSILRRLGFEKVFVHEGGIEGWPFELVK
ncbi:MAG TPA: rhodanese-like domain-containing protein [Acetomicrobium sp.]|nr:rhodanese-like domain-containing protein [Acetomicrobium sp.]